MMKFREIAFWKRLIFAKTVLVVMIAHNVDQVHAECSLFRWEPVATMPYFALAYPEENAKYWVFKFNNDAAAHLKLTLSAQFPHARYTAYTLYSMEFGEGKGSPVFYNGNIQHLEDVEIAPSSGHDNPYLDYAPRDVKNRSYTIHVVQEDSSRILPDGTLMENTLVIPADKRALALILRVYLPDDSDDPKGGVALPSVSAENELTGETLPCPKGVLNPDFVFYPYAFIVGHWYVEFMRLANDEIYSYRPGDYGLYPNGACPYLVVPLIHPFYNNGKIAVLRFKAPRFPDTRAGEKFGPDDQVRYWSVCLADWQMTNYSNCMADEEFKIDEDGFVNIVIGPDELAPLPEKWNRFSWGWIANPVLLFRQISPKESFDNSFNNAEIAFDPAKLWIDLRDIVAHEPDKIASTAIGQYAPSGRYCTIDEFLLNSCGF